MKKRDAENRLREAFEKITPDVRDQILEKAGREEDKIVPMDLRNRRRKRPVGSYIVAAVAILLLCFNVLLERTAGSANNRVSARIDIDVNPSIELSINTSDRVVSVRAVNPDANIILEGMDLTGATTKVAVNAIIGSMLQNGYLRTEKTDKILVSVTAKDEGKSEEIQKSVETNINEFLAACAVDASVITQNVVEDKEVSGMAENLGISPGKATLVQKILALKDTYTGEELAEFTIAELDELLEFLLEVGDNLDDTLREETVSENEVPEDGTVSENKVSENAVSENKVSEDTVSENEVSENPASENQVSKNEVNEKTVSENTTKDETEIKKETETEDQDETSTEKENQEENKQENKEGNKNETIDSSKEDAVSPNVSRDTKEETNGKPDEEKIDSEKSTGTKTETRTETKKEEPEYDTIDS